MLDEPAGQRRRVHPAREHGRHERAADRATVELQVRDDGPGFAPELLPRATERFARGDSSRSRATGGSGLGLAIARAIVESHGGHLAVANDSGAVVTAYLPV